jgi:hypothetical protein
MTVPARYVHVDQSYNGALEVLRDNLRPDLAKSLAKTRWGIINVWRPIHNPVSRDPLAVCDARSVAESDLVAMAAILPSKGSNSFENVSAGSSLRLGVSKPTLIIAGISRLALRRKKSC